MMAAAAGLLSQTATSGQRLAGMGVNPIASSNSETNNTSAKSSVSGITANDFLTLLVTEMKNQDPTANTDPNQYINQLVNVNSLQQLISINEKLTTAYDSSNASSDAQPAAQASSTVPVAAETKIASEAASLPVSTVESSGSSSSPGDPAFQAFINKLAHGNLSTPAANAAAQRLAHALDGHSSAPSSK
jgi:flagellar basal-body rod modification protein FlgD